MKQRELFLPPRTHAGDPASSHEAEASQRMPARDQRARILAVVIELPGLTASQVADQLAGNVNFSDEPHTRLYQVRRRLSDLKLLGLVKRGELKALPGRLRREATWLAM